MRGRWVGGLVLAVLLAGCGGSDSGQPPVEGPLPTGPDDAQAYTERFLARNPDAELSPELLAIVQLAGDGDADDSCRQRDGVDCLPYVFDQPTELTLAADDPPDALVGMVLRDAAGAPLLTQTAGGPSAGALVPAGEYVLELQHGGAQAGDVVFVRPDAPVGDGSAALQVGGAAAAMTLTASRDCVGCDFRNADLRDQVFDGATLSQSNFENALMVRTRFRGATMIDCVLLDLRGDQWNIVPYDADFTDATLSFARFSFKMPAIFAFTAIFRGAQLDETVWESRDGDKDVCKQVGSNRFCSNVNPDFRNANLSLARFRSVRFEHGFSTGHHKCTFQGAQLTSASFLPEFPRTAIDVSKCRFDREPDSGRVTSFRDANLAQMRANGADFSDADFVNARFGNVDFGTANKQAPSQGQGAILRRADFTGATLSSGAFVGADMRDAVFAGLVANQFIGVDLRFAKLAGASFAGSDLSRADFGPAAPFTAGLPNFAGARFTNGVTGTSFARQTFPSGYDGFKGADLTGTVFTRAELEGANLEGATLTHANIVGANLNFANLHNAKLIGASLGVAPGTNEAAASLRGAFMTAADLSDADLRSVNLTEAHLYSDTNKTKLLRTKLDSAGFDGAICSGVEFSGSLNNTSFVGAQLVNAVFNGATLANTKFDNAYLQGADFSAAIGGIGCTLTNSAVAAMPGTWRFEEQDGTPFIFAYNATKLGPLASDDSVRCPSGSLGPCCADGNLAACLIAKLKPKRNGPHPPIPECVPKPPTFSNCITPVPTRTRKPTSTPTPPRPTITPTPS
jgi:uncharacterized protein YjbI with pentapeptide repeats